MTADLDFFSLFACNLSDFAFFAALGIFAGSAFPLALLSKRALEQSGHFLAGSERAKRAAFLCLILAVCAVLPWLAFWAGRWHDGARIEAPHVLALIAGSAATISYLLRRWRLFGG